MAGERQGPGANERNDISRFLGVPPPPPPPQDGSQLPPVRPSAYPRVVPPSPPPSPAPSPPPVPPPPPASQPDARWTAPTSSTDVGSPAFSDQEPAAQPVSRADAGEQPRAAAPSGAARDRIVVLGRRRAGKTIFLARLYETLWRGCKLVDGRVVLPGASVEGKDIVRLTCRATTGASHLQLMKTVESMQRGAWPLATQGNTYAELVVAYRGVEHMVTALDYPGEVFAKAFLHDSYEGDAAELRAAVDRAAAAILLIDPAVVASGGAEAHEDAFGLMQAALRIRSGVDGASVPIAIVFTKADASAAFLREAGGTRAFAKRHFGQLFDNVQRTAVFASAAVGERRDARGKSVPDLSRPPTNIIEPLRYCLDSIQYV